MSLPEKLREELKRTVELDMLHHNAASYIESLEQQLAHATKQNVRLREHAKAIRGHMNLYRLFSCEGSDSYDPECAEKNLDKVSEYAEALAATSDLEGSIICDAVPVFLFRRKGVSKDFCTCDEKRFLELSGMPNQFEMKKLYVAKEL